jgi:hypothetical protein
VIDRVNVMGQSLMVVVIATRRVGVTSGKVHQPNHAGLPLDEGADRRALVLADDEVTFRKTERGPGGSGVAEIALRYVSLTGNVRPTLLGRLGC